MSDGTETFRKPTTAGGVSRRVVQSRKIVGYSGKVKKILSKFIPKTYLGITDIPGLVKLKMELDSKQGTRVLAGYTGATPCLWEFPVESDRTGILNSGDWVYSSTLTPVARPKYLPKESSRNYYVVGDVILQRELKWEHVLAHAKVKKQKGSDIPGWLKFIQTILNDGKPSMYVYGLQIMQIRPHSNGNGGLFLQPVINVGKSLWTDIGSFQVWGIYSLGISTRRDLNHAYYLMHNLSVSRTFVSILETTTTISTLFVGGAAKLSTKAVSKLAAGQAKRIINDRILKIISKKSAIIFSKMALAFSTAYIKEYIAIVSRNNRLESISTNKALLVNGINQSAIPKAVSAAVFTLLSELSGALNYNLSSLVSKGVISNFQGTLTKYILSFNKTLFEKICNELIDTTIDLQKSKKIKQSTNGEIIYDPKDFDLSSSLTESVKDIMKTATEDFVDFFVEKIMTGKRF